MDKIAAYGALLAEHPKYKRTKDMPEFVDKSPLHWVRMAQG